MLVTEFAPAKVNLALHVLGRRADGYHELDSVVAFASVGDELYFETSGETSLKVEGWFSADVPVTAENLVLKAYAALAAEYEIPPLAITLKKKLPVASGIGGGSSDAAAALRGIIRCAGIEVDPETMRRIALSLGADVPVCMYGAACRMQGVGDVIIPLERPPADAILLINPLEACSTSAVFKGMGLQPGDKFAAALDMSDPASWRNDMTSSACQNLPVIKEVLSVLREMAPLATVRMSGSGATCFALFDGANSLRDGDPRPAQKAILDADAVGEAISERYPNWWSSAALLS